MCNMDLLVQPLGNTFRKSGVVGMINLALEIVSSRFRHVGKYKVPLLSEHTTLEHNSFPAVKMHP
jgi:hypothetical protein